MPMKPPDFLTAIVRKLRGVIPLSKLSKLLKSGFRGRLRAALVGWWERLHPAPVHDQAHRFEARDYPGSRSRHYVVHLPRGKLGKRARPLVLVLHGCRQDNRDIEAITVNRWPHGYASPHDPKSTLHSWSRDLWPEEKRHWVKGRTRLGRIAIANSDAAANAMTEAAIAQAYRAVNELM